MEEQHGAVHRIGAERQVRSVFLARAHWHKLAEHMLAWLARYRRPTIHYERRVVMHRTFCTAPAL